MLRRTRRINADEHKIAKRGGGGRRIKKAEGQSGVWATESQLTLLCSFYLYFFVIWLWLYFLHTWDERCSVIYFFYSSSTSLSIVLYTVSFCVMLNRVCICIVKSHLNMLFWTTFPLRQAPRNNSMTKINTYKLILGSKMILIGQTSLPCIKWKTLNFPSGD